MSFHTCATGTWIDFGFGFGFGLGFGFGFGFGLGLARPCQHAVARTVAHGKHLRPRGGGAGAAAVRRGGDGPLRVRRHAVTSVGVGRPSAIR